MIWTLDKNSEKTLSTVKPELQKIIHKALELSPVPFAVVSGNRTAEEQKKIYGQGRPGFPKYGRRGPIVTWTLHSNHMGGNACDLSRVDAKGKPNNHDPKTWNEKHYMPLINAVLAAGKALGIPVYSGYKMWKKDWGHFQLRKQ